jgi:hypothetical protein
MKLVVVSRTAFAGYELPERGTIVLGRSGKSDLRIDDPSITRMHAKLHLVGGERERERGRGARPIRASTSTDRL